MINNRPWIEIAEYISVAASVVGSATAVISQQAIYATAPVSLALALNLVSRRRLEDLSRQKSAAAITHIEQLQSALPQLERASQSLLTAVETLYQQQQALKQSVTPMQAQLNVLSEQFKKRPELEQIESFAAVLAALKQSINKLSQLDK